MSVEGFAYLPCWDDPNFFRDWKRSTIRLPARVVTAKGDRFWCADGSVWRIKEKRGGKWTRRRVNR